MTSPERLPGNVKPMGKKKVRGRGGPDLGLPEQHPRSKYCSKHIQDKILGRATCEDRRRNTNFSKRHTKPTQGDRRNKRIKSSRRQWGREWSEGLFCHTKCCNRTQKAKVSDALLIK